ncbi:MULTISPECIES: arsenate reductase family protein [Galbibacter]|uniref:Arsenate reductase n=1 Tax=Galbibacter pacificus TaxID=2996052 RepID=A0ABT6FQG4_9FLAO|nr:hypothetical protein [Galbibacter pacificus]MDG3582016.1 hypothetical protein [Galbibacter pacificus]MDG3585510.1 hypothetical protein [Galbibacter pacificus]
MGIIATNENQIKFIFDSSTKLGRECQAYAASAGAKILAIDINKTKIADTEWAEIAERVGKTLPELIATDHPAFTNTYGTNVELDENDALKVLNKHPEAFVYPIAIRGNEAIVAHSFSDVLKLVKPDSSGIDIP